jgi:hypothetical protein
MYTKREYRQERGLRIKKNKQGGNKNDGGTKKGSFRGGVCV